MAMALPSAARLRRVGRHVAASAPRPTPSTAATVSVSPTATIHYEAYGDPQHPAIFLAHGAGGNAAVWWRNIPYMVSRGYYVVAHDARFFGTSSSGADAAEGFEGGMTFAADAVKVLDALGIDKAIFICQSMGGTTGMHAAVYFPERVAAVVMCNTHMGVALPPDLAAMRETHQAKVAELDALAAEEARANPGAHAGLGASLGGKALGQEFAKRNPELAFFYGVNGAFNAGMQAAPPGSFQDLPVEKITAISSPLLFTTSDYDPFFSKGVLRGVAALIDGAEVVHFAGHGHSVYFEDPDGFNYAVMDFLQRVCPSSTAHPKDGWL